MGSRDALPPEGSGARLLRGALPARARRPPYATPTRRRLYGKEGLARKEAGPWLREDTLTVEYAGESLSAYEVEYGAAGRRSWTGRPPRARNPTLFETSYALGQPRLFGLAETLGDDGRPKSLKLDEYAPRRPRQSQAMRDTLFPYQDAL